MAGTLFGLGLSPQFDANGDLARGCLLYLYQANTSTPVTSYADYALTSANAWPVEADSAGRLPAFWLSDGSYRARLTTSAGVEIFDEQSITTIGPSDGGTSSGSAALDTTTVFQTGDMLWLPLAGTRSGWVRANGRTLGNGSSSATERANGDTQSLFEFLWTNFSNSLCAVSGGRGASATADFNASKTIATLDMRSKGAFGLDDMGNSSAGITGASSSAAAAIGASTFTILLSNLPSTTLSIAGLSITNGSSIVKSAGNLVALSSIDVGGGSAGALGLSTTSTVSNLSISGTLSLGGSDTHINLLPPVRVGSWYIKL